MIKKILKYLCIALIVFVVGFLVLRIFVSSYKGVFDEPYFKSESEIKTLDLKDKIGERGYFCAYSMFIDEKSGDVEITVRYNKSAEKYTDTKLENFVFMLQKSDGEGKDKEYFECALLDTKTKFFDRYTYMKLIFRDVLKDGEKAEDFDLIVNMFSSLSLGKSEAAAKTPYLDRQYIHYASQPIEIYE